MSLTADLPAICCAGPGIVSPTKHSLVEIETERLAGVHRARDADQHLSKVGVDAPIVRLVGIGQSGARNPAPEAHVIKLALHRAQASFDVAEALAKRQLGKGQAKELIEAGKAAQFVIAAVLRDALVELVRRDVIDQLGEDGTAGKHALLSEGKAEGLRTRQNPLAEVHIEKRSNTIYVIVHTAVTDPLKSGSRTAGPENEHCNRTECLDSWFPQGPEYET